MDEHKDDKIVNEINDLASSQGKSSVMRNSQVYSRTQRIAENLTEIVRGSLEESKDGFRYDKGTS